MSKLSDLLSQAPKKQEQIASHGKAVQADLTAKKPFSQASKNELQSDLKDIQDYIIDLSKNCLNKLNTWNNELVKMDSEISEVSGLLQRVKADAGSRVIAPILCESSHVDNEDNYEYAQKASTFNFPNYSFDINMRALDNVGHQVDEVENPELSEHTAPLLTKIKPGEAPPLFWCTTQDFFTPSMHLVISVGDEAYKTSFSDFYEFDPVPQVVRDQRDSMKRH